VKTLDFPLWLRAAHFFNFLLLSLLIRSGLEILSTPGNEWLKFTKKQRPEDRLWTASDEETSFPSAIALPGTKIWVSDGTGTFSRISRGC
jgi:hypothetical protein